MGHITDKMLADKILGVKPVKIARGGGGGGGGMTKCWPFYETGRAKCQSYQNTLYMILMVK